MFDDQSRVRVQVLGPDGRWWTVNGFGKDEYVNLHLDRNGNKQLAGVTWSAFVREMGHENAARVRRMF